MIRPARARPNRRDATRRPNVYVRDTRPPTSPARAKYSDAGQANRTGYADVTLQQNALRERESVTGTQVANKTTSYAYNDANELCWTAAGAITIPSCSTPPAGAASYSHDGDGNQTNAAGRISEYNLRDQAIEIAGIPFQRSR